jgi:chemotaxis protein CheD
VSISDLETSEGPVILSTVLGSCIAICLYDPQTKIGSLAHALLPTIEYSSTLSAKKNPKKYVDLLIDIQLKELQSKGAIRKNLVAKIVGGANMFSEVIPVSDNHVGKKNARKAKEILENLNIPILGEDIGGIFGRRINFDLNDGKVTVMKNTGEIWRTI